MSRDISTQFGTSLPFPWISLVYPTSKHSGPAKCTPRYKTQQESARFSLNYALEQTIHQGKEDSFALARAARLPPRCSSRWGGLCGTSPALPSAVRAGDGCRWGQTSPSSRPSPLLATARCWLRRLDAPTKFELPWRRKSTGSLATQLSQYLLIVLGPLHLQLPAIIRM